MTGRRNFILIRMIHLYIAATVFASATGELVAHWAETSKIEEEVPPTAMYDQGLARLTKGDDEGAAKKFTDLGKQYPYSDWSKKGLLMTTYSRRRNSLSSIRPAGSAYRITIS